jgi:uncharacterized protein (DUF2141 family)
MAQSVVILKAEQISSDKGLCRACIFTNAKSFAEKEKPFSCKAAVIKDRKTSIEFTNLPPGYYAVTLFHDENNNGKLDTNFLGIPKEGYGASGNKLPLASRPAFEDSKFLIEDGKKVVIPVRLRYLL